MQLQGLGVLAMLLTAVLVPLALLLATWVALQMARLIGLPGLIGQIAADIVNAYRQRRKD
ncbi:hypothetical protein [Sinimarinibacterium flocculans]|uniref:Uncharacterized protein n=1 Tax=Sinimarinibacterium flocculans TaxID=985250 RepID=A0A318E5B9_9GAMM|nr:hypothetical protein [Sinimarinibacterium flocculans]PXV66470.1 hypothetical protein C8D93_10734 [Sinimarinibacterium flocculans]